eukprot:s278_g27.t1
MAKLQAETPGLLQKKGWGNCKVQYVNDTTLVELCCPSSLRRYLELHNEALLFDTATLLLFYLVPDPTKGDRLGSGPAAWYMMDLGRCSAQPDGTEAAHRDVTSALRHFHTAGLGHMDVKPANWLVQRPRIILEEVQQRGQALEFASERLRSDKEVVLEAVRQDGSMLQFASEKMRSDKEVVLEAVRQDGSMLQFASEKMRSDKEVLLEAVSQDGSMMQFASEKLRSDREVVEHAVAGEFAVLVFASEEQRELLGLRPKSWLRTPLHFNIPMESRQAFASGMVPPWPAAAPFPASFPTGIWPPGVQAPGPGRSQGAPMAFQRSQVPQALQTPQGPSRHMEMPQVSSGTEQGMAKAAGGGLQAQAKAQTSGFAEGVVNMVLAVTAVAFLLLLRGSRTGALGQSELQAAASKVLPAIFDAGRQLAVLLHSDGTATEPPVAVKLTHVMCEETRTAPDPEPAKVEKTMSVAAPEPEAEDPDDTTHVPEKEPEHETYLEMDGRVMSLDQLCQEVGARRVCSPQSSASASDEVLVEDLKPAEDALKTPADAGAPDTSSAPGAPSATSRAPRKWRGRREVRPDPILEEGTPGAEHATPHAEPAPYEGIVFKLCLLNTDLAVQSRQRLRVTLSFGPEICAETNWPTIQRKLQDFCKKRGWCNCKVQYNNGSALEELCDPNSLRRLFELHREALLRDTVELPLYVVPDPTDDTSSVIDGEEIVLEVDQQGSPILLNLRSDALLGEGGFGRVWRAMDPESHIQYGVKTVLHDERSQEHMKTEINTLLQLNHPNIIKVLQHGYVLDPVRGRLPAYMMDLGRCSVQDLLATGWHSKAAAEAAQRDMSSALQHFHAAGLGHMDVKPANWLVTNKSTGPAGKTQLELKLIDAGGAGRLGKDRVASRTAEYAHPMHRGGTYIYAFFDWYGLHKAIFLLSRSEIERGLGFRTQTEILQTAGDRLESNKAFVLEAVRQSVFALDFASNILKADKEVVIEAVRRKGEMLKSVWEGFKSDKEVVIEAVRQNGRTLEYASNELKGDKEVVMEAICQDGSLLAYASQELRGDKEIVLEAIRKYGFALKYASQQLQGDKEVVMEAIRQRGFLLEYASEELQADKEVVMEAVRKSSLALIFASNELKGDKEVVMEAVRQEGSLLKYASKELKGDKKIVLQAVRRDGCLLKYASRKLQGDKEVVIEAVRQKGRALKSAARELHSDKEVVMEAIRQDGSLLKHASEKLQADKEVVIEAVRQNGRALKNASQELKGDKEVVMEAIRQDGSLLEYVSKHLKGEKEVVIEAVRQKGTLLELASKELKSDKDVVMEAIRQDGCLLKHASEKLQADKEVVMEALRKSSHALKYASKELKGDKEVVIEAVRQKGSFLEYASKALKDDKEIVLQAVRRYGFALKFASRGLQGDAEVVMQAVRQNGLSLQYASRELRALGWRHRRFGWRARLKALIMGTVRQDGFDMNFACNTSQSHKEVVMEAVRQNASSLKHAGEKFRNDKEFVMEAVRQNSFAIKYACKELQSDKEVVAEAVRQNVPLLEYADERFRSDREFVMELVRRNGFAIKYASHELQSDKEVVMEAVRQNGSAIEYASEELQSDKEVVMEAVRQNGSAIEYASAELQSDKEVVMEAESPVETREERIARLIAEMQAAEDDWSWGGGEPKAAHDGCIYFAGAPPVRRAAPVPAEPKAAPKAAPAPAVGPLRSGRAWRAGGGSVASSKAAFDEDPDLAALEAKLEEGKFLIAKPVRFRPSGCFVRLPGGQEAFLPVEHMPRTDASTNAVRQTVNKLSRDGKLRVREIGSDRVSMLKAQEEALRGQELEARRRKMEEGIEKLRENYNPNKVMVGFVSSVLHLTGEALRLTVPSSMLGASLRKMVAKQFPVKPGAKLLLNHKTSPLLLDKSLEDQGILGMSASLCCTYASTNLPEALRFVAGDPAILPLEHVAMEGVSRLCGAPDGSYLHHLPESLQSLTFRDSFDQSLQGVNFPSSLESLTFGVSYNQNLVGVTLPTSLQNLTFGFSYNQSLKEVNLPGCLQTLTFGYSFDQSLEEADLPSNLHHLTFGFSFKQSLQGVHLPGCLQSLTFGHTFNQSLLGVDLPRGLENLTFGYLFDQSLEGVNLPGGLLNLDFGFSYNHGLQGVNIPEGLQRMTFGYSFNQSLEGTNLPGSLRKLVFGYSFDQNLEGVNLPEGLQTLAFGDCFDQSLERQTLPRRLQSLTLGFAFDHSLQGVKLPSGLQSLALGATFEQSLKGVEFPSGLQSLTFRGRLYHSLDAVDLPRNLKHLTFTFSFDQSLKGINLPRGLQTLTFGGRYNQSLEGANLPSGLQGLTFGGIYDQSLRGVNWPSGLQSLTLGDSFNQSLQEVYFPEGLQTLAFGGRFDDSLLGVNLPGGLRSLTLGNSFDQSMLGINLPSGLQNLIFGFSFNQSLEGVNLPEGLQSLTFGCSFDQSLDGVNLPTSLQSLSFGERFDQSLKGADLPTSLQSLTFGRRFNHSLYEVQWPDGLQSLTVQKNGVFVSVIDGLDALVPLKELPPKFLIEDDGEAGKVVKPTLEVGQAVQFRIIRYSWQSDGFTASMMPLAERSRSGPGARGRPRQEEELDRPPSPDRSEGAKVWAAKGYSVVSSEAALELNQWLRSKMEDKKSKKGSKAVVKSTVTYLVSIARGMNTKAVGSLDLEKNVSEKEVKQAAVELLQKDGHLKAGEQHKGVTITKNIISFGAVCETVIPNRCWLVGTKCPEM